MEPVEHRRHNAGEEVDPERAPAVGERLGQAFLHLPAPRRVEGNRRHHEYEPAPTEQPVGRRSKEPKQQHDRESCERGRDEIPREKSDRGTVANRDDEPRPHDSQRSIPEHGSEYAEQPGEHREECVPKRRHVKQ